MLKIFSLLVFVHSFALVSSLLFSQTAIGIFNGHNDIGTAVKPGEATYIAATRQYVISGAGYNIWGDHDEFHFVWKKIKGDFFATILIFYLENSGTSILFLQS